MVKKSGNNRDEGPRRSKEVERALSKATLKFSVPKANETQITAKFQDALGNEVKEYISVYDESDSNALLVTLCKQIYKIGQTYGLFAEKSKGLAQVLARALRDEEANQGWLEEMQARTNWTQTTGQEARFFRMIQSLTTKVFGDQAYENQITAMEYGLTYSGYDHVQGIKRLFTINDMLPYLGTGAESMTIKRLQKYILYALKGQCKSQYIDRDGDELRTKAEIIKCIERCEKSIALKMDMESKMKS
mmetsp:Transcript_34254/g.72076  ORF Transcript_34254/g.72076 Transcript_34254/m.72076 type:complete len:247 (-) Transcript_34254:1885-2625(-)